MEADRELHVLAYNMKRVMQMGHDDTEHGERFGSIGLRERSLQRLSGPF
jgi:hypothetical protein